MKVLTPGHRYELDNFDQTENLGQVLNFIHKEPVHAAGCAFRKSLMDGTPDQKCDCNPKTLATICDGTTNEEVLAVLIDRIQFLNAKFPCKENAVALTHIETALLWLEKRTNDRKKRGVEGQHKA